jgi:hypothetical protein
VTDDDPYRPDPSGAAQEVELARLAAEGQRRIQQASNAAAAKVAAQPSHDATVEASIRASLGAHYGTPVRKVGFVFLWACPVMLVLAVGSCLADGGMKVNAGWQPMPMISVLFQVLLFFVCVPLGLVLSLRKPICPPARLAAERAWAASLPFAMDQYFYELGASGRSSCHLTIRVVFLPGRTPDAPVLQGLLGLVDIGAKTATKDGDVRIRSGVISTQWNNSEIVGYTHRLIDEVLLPLHQSHAIERIVLSSSDLSLDEL